MDLFWRPAKIEFQIDSSSVDTLHNLATKFGGKMRLGRSTRPRLMVFARVVVVVVVVFVAVVVVVAAVADAVVVARVEIYFEQYLL
jgi:hypothetical protein